MDLKHLSRENWDSLLEPEYIWIYSGSSIQQLTVHEMQPHITLLLFHRFCCFTRCQFILANSINWLAIPLGGRIRQNDHFLLVERSTNCVVYHSSNIWRKDTRIVNLSACWPFKQNFRPLISISGWRRVELQPKGLWFKAQLTWIIFIFCYNIPYYSLLLCLIWRNVAQMVNTSLFCPLEQKKSGHFAWS